MKIKNIIKEELRNSLLEFDLTEDYPSSFDMEHFKSLPSFNKRIQYCQEHLQRISSGSSRIVYKIDDEKVLKLAKNQRGLAQNEVEIGYKYDYAVDTDIIATVFDHHDDNLWVEMELATKCTPKKFEQIVGVNWDLYCDILHNHGIDIGNKRNVPKRPVPQEIVDEIWNSEGFTYSMLDFIGNYGLPVGDLMRISSYGIVKRNGQEFVVLIDYGLTDDVYNSYYQ